MTTRSITCTCSEAQLNHVGCDCVATLEAVVVHVFKDGYASDNKGKLIVDGGLDVNVEVRKAFGSFATIYRQYPLLAPIKKDETFSPEYVREMSKGG